MMPLNDIELEKTVLGGMLLEADGLNFAMPVLKDSDLFYTDAHKYIFRSIKNLFDNNEPVNILTVTVKLREQGNLKDCGGAFYISELTNSVVNTANIEYYCRILTELYIKRKLNELGMKLSSDSLNPTLDAIEILDNFQQDLADANSYLINGSGEMDYAQAIDETLKRITEPRKTQITGIATGNGELSATICGWNKQLYYIFCGRPSHFKTTREIQFAIVAASEGQKVAIFSPDQSGYDLRQKLISNISEVSLYKIRTQTYSEQELYSINLAGERLKKMPIFIDERSDCSPGYIKVRAREIKRKEGLDLIIVDNIHAMNPDGKRNQSEEVNISNISRGLKVIPKQLDAALIALCHLNRQCEDRENKRPQLSDLRYSGAIEQDADCVFYSYHPWKYYEKVEKDPDYSHLNQDEYYRMVEIGILKNKLGDTGGRIVEYVDKHTGVFSNNINNQF